MAKKRTKKQRPAGGSAAAERGVAFPVGPDGTAGTMAVNRQVFADAVRPVDAEAAADIEAEESWRRAYIGHIVRLVELGIRSEEVAMNISRAGLESITTQMQFRRDETVTGVTEAMAAYTDPGFGVTTVAGRSRGPVPPLAVPYRNRILRGDGLRRQLDTWVRGGIVEPSFAEAVRLVMRNRDWLDLSDQTVAVLGAGSEMGPFTQLCQWGATVYAADLPRTDVWRQILATARRGRGQLNVPVPLADRLAGAESRGPDDDAHLAKVAGVDLIADAPEVRTWLADAPGPLALGNYTYADGGTHVRLSVAIDAIMVDLQRRRDDLALAFLATPTDVFAVPWDAVADARRRYRDTSPATLAKRSIGLLSRGAVLEPHYRHAAYDEQGAPYGLADNLVVQQGPNYALAKRMQRWRASVARDEGATVSLNIAPPTRTRSVLKNSTFATAYAGMKRFGLEVFDPPAANALMAAMLVHDLRNPASAAHPDVPLDNPLELFVRGANHGGMWRCPYEPNSVMGAAYIAGLFERRA